MSLNLLKPAKLQRGDTVMTVSMSWGGAGEILHRYKTGVRQLEERFGLRVKPAPNSLRSAKWITANPKARADDFMYAFQDREVKAIISNIGGEDSIRTLPFIDLEIIKENPKIFLGFSDSTIAHLAMLKAGIGSFYGPAILAGFAENGGIFPYLADSFEQICFNAEPAGILSENKDGWTNERLEWEDKFNASTRRKMQPSIPWKFLQIEGKVSGHLIGGCIEVLEMVKGTDWFPAPDIWDGAILFLETSEEKIPPEYFRWYLRNYAAQGVFHRLNGILLGRPYDNVHASAYEENLIKVVREEEDLSNLPIVTQMDFGHSEPMMTLPIGVTAEIDSSKKTVSLLEAAVVD